LFLRLIIKNKDPIEIRILHNELSTTATTFSTTKWEHSTFYTTKARKDNRE
jgi:hypothetical protein